MVSIVDKLVFDLGGKTLVSLAPDNNTLCVANKNGLTKILKTNSPEEEPETLDSSKSVSSLRCYSNSYFLMTTMQGDALKYSIDSTQEELLARFALPLRDCCVIHSGKMGVFGGDDLELILLELDDEMHKKHTIKIDEQVSQISYNSQMNILAVSMINGKVQLFSLTSTIPNKVHELNDYIVANSYDDTHRDKILSNMMDDINKESDNDLDDAIDSSENNVNDPEFCSSNRICTRVAWHPKGLHFALPCSDDTVKIFTIKGYSLQKTLTSNYSSAKAHFIDLQFDPLRGTFIAAVDLNNKLTVWNWETSEIHYTKVFKRKLTNFAWKIQPDLKTLDIIIGTWSGSIVTVQNLAESVVSSIPDESVTESSTKQGLFVDSDSDLENLEEEGSAGKNYQEANSEDVFTQNHDDPSGSNEKRKYNFEDEEDFIDDDDGAGYTIGKKPRNDPSDPRSHKSFPSTISLTNTARFRYKPFSPAGTPFGFTDRRYLTMNEVGYVSTVKNSDQYSITVSFFDIGRFREYHFEDLFGYDLCFLNEKGTLFGQSKTGQIQYRPHDTIHSNWTKVLPLNPGERITSIAATPVRVVIGTSLGYFRSFNQFGVPFAIEKTSPIVAITAQDYRVFSVHYSQFHGLSYSLFELSPSITKYYQRERPLPIGLPNLTDMKKGTNIDFYNFNPMGIKSLFFSSYGDPCIFGFDNTLLLLSRWRSFEESKWLPVLDSDMEIWKMSGGKETTDIHVWPLSLTYDTLNCILVKGKHIWPEFPLPLPSEMEIRMPVFVKSRLLEEKKAMSSKKNELRGDAKENEEEEDKEISVPITVAAEEEFLRSKVLSELLTDTLENDGEMYGNENEVLSALNSTYDKALLRLFASACSDQNVEKALSLAHELKQDRALNAAAKISERAELTSLVKRINDIREARYEQQLK
ncbi:ctf4p [Saccharomyces arboricola H-6]|uniref:Ctf4p n=1 Tax=Saccharomyces arboricola (strain H-6 / AS 2.3317 / CBS 10644) TaxID=1160507 RepID=J8LGV8_SACAR|nr:ctf4p [Saccharomyces arboricola H-6]